MDVSRRSGLRERNTLAAVSVAAIFQKPLGSGSRGIADRYPFKKRAHEFLRHGPAVERPPEIQAGWIDRDELVVDHAELPSPLDQHVLRAEIQVNEGEPGHHGITPSDLGAQAIDFAGCELTAAGEELEIRLRAIAPLAVGVVEGTSGPSGRACSRPRSAPASSARSSVSRSVSGAPSTHSSMSTLR